MGEVFVYARYAMIALSIGRLLLILITLKYLRISRVYFYYNIIVLIVE